ncbi:MAG: YfbU family protein [Actinomycetota bacterium]|jgi:hypothetical protein|nr:YfbU family protein [Actinomycetota bacterium]
MSDYDDLSAPTSLSPFERQALALQHEILSHLDKDEADYHRRMQKVLTQGFTAEYADVFSPDSELPHDDCRLLHDILDMFRVMKASIGELDDAERDALLADHKYDLCFQGFDGNDAREGKMASYVDYLQATDRWTDLAEDVKAADGGNSHSLMLGRYEGMLRVFRPIWKEAVRGGGPAVLTAEQLRQIAAGRG